MRLHDERRAIRRSMRAARQRLGTDARRRAAEQVARRIDRLGLLREGLRLGVYLATNGELDAAPVIELAARRGCEIHVPVITRFSARRMHFVALRPGSRVRANRWGIPEPVGPGRSGRWLDLVLAPCVAFDASGNRLGMGAGFYDRHFAFLALRHAWRQPRLLGLAYDFQRVEALSAHEHDIPLWGVVTDRGCYGCRGALDAPQETAS